ncbi:formate dehydrogenase accessory protein FdhE [Desulfitobacterium sp. THU1]|uniref:formate dehydrogenase accessory protein FdhE domain-containing protein n=1 Tax=Desulfitobacterium sp. THU1 TaxID=3138072 RepID=UPI00311DE89E
MQRNIPNNELNEQHLAAVRENYLKLQAEIQLWQDSKAPEAVAAVRLAQTSPYFTLDSLPEDSIIELWERLNQVAGDPREGVELRVLLHDFKRGETLEDAIAARLQLALAGVAQACQTRVPAPSEENQLFGACPVCGEKHFMTVLARPLGKRYQRCLVCSYQRPVNASGCASCGSEDAKNQTYLKSANYPGIEVCVCSDCGSYFKQVDLREMNVQDLVWEDIRTMPLNYAAEQWLAGQKGWN